MGADPGVEPEGPEPGVIGEEPGDPGPEAGTVPGAVAGGPEIV